MAYRSDPKTALTTIPQSAGRSSDIPKGMIGAAARGLSRLITGADSAWFGPNQPLPPVAQEVEGRALDYPFGINLQYQPKIYDNESGISFPQLRRMAEGCEIVTLCVETRKDQMEKLSWSVKPRDDDAQPDKRCEAIQAFLQFPDRITPWKTWLRKLLDDLLVIDAPAIYARKTNGGAPYAFEIMDGSLFKVLVQPDGRRPIPPQPAYQQILKGVPAVDYTAQELIYMPRNPRTHKLYGFSPVEQILVTCNTFIRRALYQMKYYTSGTIPEGFLEAPSTWSQTQVIEFQKYLDLMIAGDLDKRNQALVVANGMKFNEAKQPQLTDEFDQWLARIVCYAFSLPATPFIKQMNRATADNAKDMALEEGLAPLMGWVKALVDLIIVQYFGFADLEFNWDQEKDTDPLIQAQIHQIYLGANTGKQVLTQNEVRNDLGLDPVEGGDTISSQDAEAGDPNDPAAAAEEVDGKDTNSGDAAKVATFNDLFKGKKKVFKPVSRKTKAMRAGQTALTKHLTDFFADVGPHITRQVTQQYAALKKADDDSNADDIADDADLSYFDRLVARVRVIIQGAAVDGATGGFKQLAVEPSMSIVQQVHKKAVKFAQERAAEMVGRKWFGNVLVDNPDAEYAITDATREFIRQAVEQALQEGWSTDQLAAKLMERAFSPERATKIARTEMISANVSGNLIAWEESQVVVGKAWILGENPCDICKTNAEQGFIPLKQTFKSGDQGPAAHPFCECDLIPTTNPKDLEQGD